MKWLKYSYSLFCLFFLAFLACVNIFLFVCFHPYDKSMCFFYFGSLQIFSFLVFVFSFSQSLKKLPQKFGFAIWALLFCLKLHHFLCIIWPPACLTFFQPKHLLLRYLYFFFFLFFLKGWIIDASDGASQNALLSKVPILSCQMAFIIWHTAVF